MRIYLDNNATTKIAPSVCAAMVAEMAVTPANPSSLHADGRAAKERLDKARTTIAAYFGWGPKELLFTGSATEALNTLIRGIGGPIVTSEIEHSAVYNTCKELEKKKVPVVFLKPDRDGVIPLTALASALTSSTKLLILSAANGEIGSKADLNETAKIVSNYPNLIWVVDGVALLGKEPIKLPSRVDGAVFTAHKAHGPAGIAVALIRQTLRANLSPLITGGQQESYLRAGTENMVGIAGFAAAIELLGADIEKINAHMRTLRDLFESILKKAIPKLIINGAGAGRLPNTSNLYLGVDGESLHILLDQNGLSTSLGSACSSGSVAPSRPLIAMGADRTIAKNSLRFSLCRYTTEREILSATTTIISCVQKLHH